MLNQHTSNNTLQIALGDKVQIKLKEHSKHKKHDTQNIGTVLFYGHVESHKGTYYGIAFDAPDFKNDGTYKKRKYFDCKPKHGLFVQLDQILKIMTHSQSNTRIHFNSIVTIPDYGTGKVRFAGLASFNPGIWYGIELQKTPVTHHSEMHSPKTSHANGTVSGITYFKCTPGNAIFRRKQVIDSILGNAIDTQIKIPSLASTDSSPMFEETKYTKHTKHIKIANPKFRKTESAPYSPGREHTPNGKLMDLSAIDNVSDSDEIKEYNNDHSNETEDDGYDYPPKLMALAPSDEMYGDDEQHSKHRRPRKNTGIMIHESDTSDIDDMLGSAAAIIFDLKQHKGRSVPVSMGQIETVTHSHNMNINAYLEHLQERNSLSSPKSYASPQISRKSLKKLKLQFKKACSPVPAEDKIVKMSALRLEYSTSSPTEDVENDGLPCPENLKFSKSVPPSPISTTNTPKQRLKLESHSVNGSPTESHGPLTFPTMSLNTDDAMKVSTATPNQQTFKVLLIGQSRVGKTALIRRLVKGKFIHHYKMTLGAALSQFKCEVPIDLIEEVEADSNIYNSMTNFFLGYNGDTTVLEQVNEQSPDNTAHLSLGLNAVSADPWDEQDKNAEFGADYDYNTQPNEEYTLSKMDQSSNHLGVGLFDYHSSKSVKNHSKEKSITDYGSFTMPELDTSLKDVRKISMKLEITLEIVDMGFHPTQEELFNDVNAIVLVVDCSKKSSVQDAIDKYQTFLKNSLYVKSQKRKRKRSRSSSNAYAEDIKREYIPVIVAVNKSEIKNNKKQFKKRDVRKMIYKKLVPIIEQNFPESDTENAEETKSEDETVEKHFDFDSDTESNEPSIAPKHSKRKERNFTNNTLLMPPNLSFVYDESEASDSELDTEDEDSDFEYNPKKRKQNGSDLLEVTRVYHKSQQSSPGDPFNTPRNIKKKRRKKSSKKTVRRRRDKNDIRYIDIIQCSAKSGQNVDKIFGTCIKKTIPSKLTKSVAHKRTKTTAHVTAPIWLRQVVAEFQNDVSNDGHQNGYSMVDDNFTFLGDRDHSD